MKKATVVAFVVVFAVCMFHYFYSEDHCPVHCPSKGGQIGHVHLHHGGASSCLCFWSSLFGPEMDDFARALDYRTLIAFSDEGSSCAAFGADISHPPKSPLA